MPVFVKKFILSFLVFLTVFMSVAPSLSYVKAQATGTWYSSSFTDWFIKVYDENLSPSGEIFGERYTAAQVQWVFYGLLAIPINAVLDKMPGVRSCIFAMNTVDPAEILNCGVGIAGFMAKVATLGLASMISQTEDPNYSLAQDVLNSEGRQISGLKYVRGLSSRLSPVKPAQAQGFGYTALDPIQRYWSGFRNMAYSIIVLITIVFAFMVMFKVKLNPQTVVSVQSALPTIIGGVILATFSYAIAGFLIDLMYVVGGIFAMLMQLAGFSGSVSSAYHWIIPSAGNMLGSFTILWFMVLYAISFLVALIAAILSIIIGNLLLWGIFGGIVGLLFIILLVWIVVLVFVYMVKIPWVLIKNLISIYMSIVVAPLQIIMGTLVPSMGFGTWLKKLISELLVFPVTGLFMYLAMLTLGTSFKASAGMFNWSNVTIIPAVPGGTELWAPEIIGSTGSMSPLIWLAVSFGFIAMLPKVVDLMKAMIMGERFSFGNALQEAVGPLNWAKNQALGVTGVGDMWELAQIARRSRIMKKYYGQDGALNPLVRRFIGGDDTKAKHAIEKQITNYEERSGGQEVRG